MEKDIFKDLESRMEKAIATFREELSRVRTGRAALSLLDSVKVDYYGNPSPLNHVANLAVPDNRMITIQPWDVKMLPEIERAIIKSDLGLTPQNDGKIIRLPIPPLNEERRKDLVKLVKKMAEEHRVAVRNVRRDGIEKLQKQEKEKIITEDQKHTMQKKVQDLTDSHIKKVDEVLAAKEKEIMEV
jgi:ribosome recycling factor